MCYDIGKFCDSDMTCDEEMNSGNVILLQSKQALYPTSGENKIKFNISILTTHLYCIEFFQTGISGATSDMFHIY